MEGAGGLAILLVVGITGMDAGIEEGGKEEERAGNWVRPG